MTSRREFLHWAAALAAAVPAARSVRALAQQRITQDDLLAFEPLGQVTLIHIADLHAQLMPAYVREPVTAFDRRAGRAYLDAYAVSYGSPLGYALAGEDFLPLAKSYGKVGGLDRIATVVNAIQAQRPEQTLLLDGGDSWHGSYATLQTRGEDMVEAMNFLGVEAMTGHWEFMLGRERVLELAEKSDASFLAENVRDTEWNDEPFDGYGFFDVNGVNIAVIGLAYAHTAAAAPWIVPNLSFAVDPVRLRNRVSELRGQGAQLIVLLSHNGRAFDRKLATLVPGIDVIFSAHSHDGWPIPEPIGTTLLIGSGAHGKFVSRLDLQVQNNRIAAHRYRLIPVLADAIAPDAEMAELVTRLRAPFDKAQRRVLGRTESLLYRRDVLEGTMDNVILDALAETADVEIALSPGFRWGATLLPGQDITVEDVLSHVASPYGNTYKAKMSGEAIKAALEAAADAVFNPDPFNRLGRDMARVGGLSFSLDPAKPAGARIFDVTLLRNNQPLDAGRSYTVAGWAGSEPAEGPPIWDVVSGHIERRKTVRAQERRRVRLAG